MNDLSAANLRARWSLLRQEAPRHNQRPVSPITLMSGALHCWASVSDSYPALLAGPTGASSRTDWSSGQIKFSNKTILHASEDIECLEILCVNPALEEIFAEFCAVFLRRMYAGDTPYQAAERTIDDFAALLGGMQGGALPSNSDVGLLGELLVLRQLVREDWRLHETWAGPEAGRHDFRFGKNALEVKTSRLRHTETIAIASIRQLQEPRDGRLYLVSVVLERDAGGDISLKSLRQDISQCIPPADRATVLARLDGKPGADSLSDERWTVHSITVFRVQPDFPRLTPGKLISGELDPGVSHVTYRLNLDYASGFRTEGSLAGFLTEESSE